jgi:hypothetical protein
MPPIKNKIEYQKYLVYLKDLIYIISILFMTYQWISTKSKNEAKNQQTLELNTKAVEQNTEAIKKVNDYLFEQNKFNGQVEEYMKNHE